MKNPRLIKRRLNSIKNIRKITKALEIVSTSKIQKAKEKAFNAKPFQQKVYELIQTLAWEADLLSIPLLKIPEDYKSDLYVLITTNKGLLGSLNTNLFRFLENLLKKNCLLNHTFITIGKKGRNFARSNGQLMADFSESDSVESVVSSLVKMIIDSFVSGKFAEVYLVYNDFVSVFSQEPKARKILPIRPEEILASDNNQPIKPKKYTFEPSPKVVLNKILPFYLEVQVTEAIFETEASEHAARMMAMRNASDNALELSQSLHLEFNKARQQAITSEINDINNE